MIVMMMTTIIIIFIFFSSNTVPSQQECCYDNQGELLLDSPGGGAVNLVAADINGPGHFWQDVRPYLLCCVSDQTSCDKFYQRRPSDSGDDFEPKRPGKGWTGEPGNITSYILLNACFSAVCICP